jgi:predicted nucleic acid-binding protein
VVTNYVVAEAHGLAVGRIGRDFALELLRRLDGPTFAVVRVDVPDELAARRLIERYADKSFSLVDAMSFVVMNEMRITTAFAFDDHFAQYGFTTL